MCITHVVHLHSKQGRKNPFYAKFLPPGEKKQRMLPGSTSATAEGAAIKLAWYVATQQELRAVVPLTKPRKSAEVRCSHALRLISCVCLTHTHTLMSQEVHLMKLANEAEKLGILAMRLGSENIPVQPVHPVPPGMRFAHAVAAEPCGSPIDFGLQPRTSCGMWYWLSTRHMPQTSELRKPHALSVSVRLLVNASSQFKYDI